MNAGAEERGAEVGRETSAGTIVLTSPADPRAAAWRALFAGWKLCLGSWLSTFLVLGVLVVGWATRAAQREVLRTWWRRSPARARGLAFDAFAAGDAATEPHTTWPNWILGVRRSDPGEAGRWKSKLRRAGGGLGANAKFGLQVAGNTWLLTLPGCLLWTVAWFAGWQNSFNKGYEHAWFGPTIFMLGMLLFSAAMGYVPFAQARQASTGDWRRFHDYRLIWRLIRRRWLASVGLALVWAGGSGVVLVVKVLPALAQYVPQLGGLPPPAALAVSERFFVFVALLLFPVFVALRLLAARVYADALRSGYQAGAVTEDELGEAEWQALRRLELLTPQPGPERRWFVRLAAWLATRAGQITAAAAVLLIWFVFSFFVLISDFLAKTENGRGWWNQPMIQLPWFDYTPNRLREEAKGAKVGEPEVAP